jgi:uncharacterized membrane protein
MLIAALLGFILGIVTMAVIWYVTNWKLTIKAWDEYNRNLKEARKKAEDFVNNC